MLAPTHIILSETSTSSGIISTLTPVIFSRYSCKSVAASLIFCSGLSFAYLDNLKSFTTKASLFITIFDTGFPPFTTLNPLTKKFPNKRKNITNPTLINFIFPPGLLGIIIYQSLMSNQVLLETTIF